MGEPRGITELAERFRAHTDALGEDARLSDGLDRTLDRLKNALRRFERSERTDSPENRPLEFGELIRGRVEALLELGRISGYAHFHPSDGAHYPCPPSIRDRRAASSPRMTALPASPLITRTGRLESGIQSSTDDFSPPIAADTTAQICAPIQYGSGK
jgi:hypothetical protein